MSEFVKFYRGTESEYETIKDNGLLQDYFYFTQDETDGRYRLRLKEQLVFSSNSQEETAEIVIGSQKFKTEIAKYLPLNGGTITGNLIVDNTLTAKNINTTENISFSCYYFRSFADRVAYGSFEGAL